MTIVTPEYQIVTIITEHFTEIFISNEETYLKMLHTLIVKLRSRHMRGTCFRYIYAVVILNWLRHINKLTTIFQRKLSWDKHVELTHDITLNISQYGSYLFLWVGIKELSSERV